LSMLRREVIALVGAVAAWPLMVRAQQPVIGFLSSESRQFDDTLGVLAAFRQSLNEAGYVEGREVAIEYRWAEGNYDRLPVLAAELVRRQVTAIVTAGAPSAFAAKAATSTIPIVFNLGIDPIEFGLVASLNRSGGNATGVALMGVELAPKLLDFLHELLPTAAVIGVLTNPSNARTDSEIRRLRDAERLLGLRLHFLRASIPAEIEAAFEALIELQVHGVVVIMDPFSLTSTIKLWRWPPVTRCRRSTDGEGSPQPVA